MKRNSLAKAASVVLSCAMLLSASYGSIDPAVFSAGFQPAVVSAAAAGISDFSMTDFKMTDAYAVNAFSKEVKYLLSFDNNKLLAGFRDNAGLNTQNATRYGGWENTLIGGHTVGHYLSALAQAYTNPNLSESDRTAVMNKIKALVDGMAECQKNSKGQPGFLWAAVKKSGKGVEFQFDNVEAGKTSSIFDDAWVPWYTMHKLIQGFVDVYKFTGYENAKNVASGLGDWTYNRTSKWSSQTQSVVLRVEYGGMNDCLYELYKITGKQSHADAAHKFDETALYDKVMAGGANVLNGRHANTTIPKFIGALKRYIVIGATEDKYLKYAEAFWDNVISNHTYVTGGNSEWEHFGMDNILDKERTNCNCETCNSYNMLKLSRELFKITGNKKYMDYYERTYYNSILSSQNPETGMTTYFQPMATGYFKVYSSQFDHFWCCTGSGMESFSKLGDTIYMKNGNTLYVNLYQSSVLDWKEQSVKITQESTIPDGDKTTFTIDGSGSLDLRFRIPDWIAGSMTIKVNGEKTSFTEVDGYAQLKKDFGSGDKIEITMPEKVVAHALPDNGGNAYAFTYGPIVLSAELGTADMKKGSTGMWVSIPEKSTVSDDTIYIKGENGSVASYMSEIDKYLVKDSSGLKFKLTGTDKELTFTPHYRQYQQRYGIYWHYKNSGQVVEKPVKKADFTVTDTVQPGYGQYEIDDLHKMAEYHSESVTDDSTYRYTTEGNGYFGYRMAVDDEADYSLLTVTFRKEDNGKTIKIRVGNRILYNQKLNYTGTESTYDVKLKVPADLVKECAKEVEAMGETKKVVDVFFASTDGKPSARICDFIYMTAVKTLYSVDSTVAYFVDCGDHNTNTITGNDKFGFFNSRTDQAYGPDEVTGASWGVIDDTKDQYNGASKSSGVYTANTWCQEQNTADGQNKANTNRYTKNQYENNIARHIDYGFDLPDGDYNVEIGFCDPWKCSNYPTVYANYGQSNQSTVAEKVPLNGSNGSAKGKVNVTGGKLTLNFRSEDKAINVSYIIIKAADNHSFDQAAPASTAVTAGIKGDVNADGKVDSADALSMSKFMFGSDVLLDGYNADMDDSSSLGILDMVLLRSKIIS